MPRLKSPGGISLLTTLLSLSAILLSFVAVNDAFQLDNELELALRKAEDRKHPIRSPVESCSFSSLLENAVSDIHLVPRQDSAAEALSNNDPRNKNIDAKEVQHWIFPKQELEALPGEIGPGLPSDDEEEGEDSKDLRQDLRKRQSSKRVYITLNTCIQPIVNTSLSQPDKIDDSQPPQLQLWISQSSSLTTPGPDTQDDPDQMKVEFESGYASFDTDTAEDIYIGVSAPESGSFRGSWNYEIAASIDAPFHALGDKVTSLFFVDGDDQAALLVTSDTTKKDASSKPFKKWMALSPPPFGVFAHNRNDSANVLGIQNSFCGLKNQAQIAANIPRARGISEQNTAAMVDRGGMGGKPKQEFYIANLNASSRYWGFLAMDGNSTASGAGVVGGGGMVWPRAIKFATKTEANCKLLYNLTFCTEVAYAVPSNPDFVGSGDPAGGGEPSSSSSSSLATFYDNYAADLYRNFNFSLQQIPCQAPPVQQYSLVRNCDDCANAYKTWLCAVTIPRCEDFGSRKRYLLERNVGADFLNGSSPFEQFFDNDDAADDSPVQSLYNRSWRTSAARNSSRNPLIDSQIRPGPYKEVLPCEDLCYDLIQSCPARLGFSCPLSGRGLELSYGTKNGRSTHHRHDQDDDDDDGNNSNSNGNGDEEKEEDRWDGEVRCSYPGAVHFRSDATTTMMVRAGEKPSLLLLGSGGRGKLFNGSFLLFTFHTSWWMVMMMVVVTMTLTSSSSLWY